MDFNEIDKRISKTRVEYSVGELNEEELSSDPFEQFGVWFQDALDQKVPQANAFTLATASKSGIPSARVVLVKRFDPKGFVFFSNYESQKAKDIEENPHASLVIYWVGLERQVVISGKIAKVSQQESEAYFNSRPRSSKIAASISCQSQPIESRAELDKKFEAFEKQMEGNEIPCPATWGGYRLTPHLFEFWQGRGSRLNDRVLYSLKGDSWMLQRLQP